jgi:phage FluMu protein Com
MYRCKNCGKMVIFGDSLIPHELFKAFCPKCKNWNFSKERRRKHETIQTSIYVCRISFYNGRDDVRHARRLDLANPIR